jgi:hypothetical protein
MNIGKVVRGVQMERKGICIQKTDNIICENVWPTIYAQKFTGKFCSDRRLCTVPEYVWREGGGGEGKRYYS